MKNLLIYLYLLLAVHNVFGQLTAQKFITGSGQLEEGCWDAFIMDFATTPPSITPKPGPPFPGNGGGRGHMTVCDRNGNVQFGFDNAGLYNSTFETMKGAHNLMPFYNAVNNYNYIWQQGCIAVPVPGCIDEKYFVFYLDKLNASYTYIGINKLMYGMVDMQADGGLGEMYTRDRVILTDSLDYMSGLSAVRHGNGRDWWIICYTVKKGYRFHRFLVTQDGVFGPMTQDIYNPIISDLNAYDQRVSTNYGFSPDGTKLARFAPVFFPTRLNCIEYYDFDRCTGALSNLQYYLPDSVRWGHIVWSPNSRFIYAVYLRDASSTSFPYIIDSARTEIVLQIDTWNPDTNTNAYRVYELPRFQAIPHPNPNCIDTPGPGRIDQGILGLNGKVYLSSQQSFFSTIHQPDSLGAACDFRFGDLLANQMFWSMPAYINYQLYDKPGSPCDTSGVNGYTSVSPTPVSAWYVEVSPNPMVDRLQLNYRLRSGAAIFRLFDMTGCEVRVEHLAVSSTQQDIPTSHLPPGLYFYTVTDGAGLVGSGKVVKME